MSPSNEPIAVVGSGCRFPGEANSPSKLWELLSEPRDLNAPIPHDRFDVTGFYHVNNTHHGSCNVRNAYTLSEDIRRFDPNFFNIKPIEAEAIDPQHRILLETVYESLEAAGMSIADLQGSSTAVYAGLMNADYTDLTIRDLEAVPQYMATGTARSLLSNRISYFFDWHGASMTIDTACSSSLVAVHEAVQCLRNGNASLAVATGANLIIGPEFFISTTNLGMLSPEGRSRMWDADANGYARGEGLAAIVLKPLSAAIRDGDRIECVIRETGVNSDGRTKGITMPSAVAQARLIRETYAKAGLDPRNELDRCQFFEAHGTGTKAGDPQEASAIADVFFESEPSSTPQQNPLYVGSIKTLIGHTEGTAGLAGLLKASLAVQHGVIPPNMLLNRLSPAVRPFYDNLEVPKTSMPWPELPAGVPRRVSVNSFGFGGTNSHAIIESFEPSSRPIIHFNTPVSTPFTFSAATDKSLNDLLRSYSTYLQKNPDIKPNDLAWTLNNRRSVLPYKAAFSARDIEDLSSQIIARLGSNETGIRSTGKPVRLGVFTGQGAQWPGMAAQLLLHSLQANETLGKLEASLRSLPEQDRPSWSIKEELMKGKQESRLQEAALSQPLCTAVQIMLVDALRIAGVGFDAVVGHSSGEIAAAYTAGFISAHDAIRIAYYRGYHAHRAQGPNGESGAMMAVGLSLEEARALCQQPDFFGKISPAASNSSSSVTLSGNSAAIEMAKARLDANKTFARLLKVDTAYHSHHMSACSSQYLSSLQQCSIQVAQGSQSCRWFSSVHSREMHAGDDLKDTYWKDNMVNTVLFSQAVTAAIQEMGQFQLAAELGPHPALRGPCLQSIQEVQGSVIPYFGLLEREKNDVMAFSRGLGSLWCHTNAPTPGKGGVRFAAYDAAFSGVEKRNLLGGLPSYTWDHDRQYWSEGRISKTIRGRTDPVHALLGRRTPESTEEELRWTNILRPKELHWLSGHNIQGQTIFPASGYVALALEAALIWSGGEDISLIEILNLVIERSIPFNDDDVAGVEILVRLSSDSNLTSTTGQASAKFSCLAALHKDGTTLVPIASATVVLASSNLCTDSPLPPRGARPVDLISVDVDRFYQGLSQLGYNYSGPFRALQSIERKVGHALGRLADPAADPKHPQLLVHPGTLDVAIQTAMAAFSFPGDGALWSIHVPTSIDRISVDTRLCRSRSKDGSSFHFESLTNTSRTSGISADVRLFEAGGQQSLVDVDGLHLISLFPATSEHDRLIFSQPSLAFVEPDVELAERCAISSGSGCHNATLAGVVKQIIDRRPQQRILHFGADLVAPCKEVLSGLDSPAASYTVAHGDLVTAQSAQDTLAKEGFKVHALQLSLQSGLEADADFATFDTVIAPDATWYKDASICQHSLMRLRGLLKSGGYLLASKPKDIGSGISDVQLHVSLQKSGFTGIDSMTSASSSQTGSTNVFLSQATDDRLTLLLDPFQSTPLQPQVDHLVVLGGTALATTKLVEIVRQRLAPWCQRIIHLESLEMVNDSVLPPRSTVLSLFDLDEPIFKRSSWSWLGGLKTTLRNAKTLLWVTRECRNFDAAGNMSLGAIRTLSLELPDVRLQTLDLESDTALDASVIIKCMLRLINHDALKASGDTKGLSWTVEPEIALEQGRLVVPRWRHARAMNDRVNSAKRSIRDKVDHKQQAISTYMSRKGWNIRQPVQSLLPGPESAEASCEMKVYHSTASAIRIDGLGYLHLVVGELRNGDLAVGLSDTSASLVRAPPTLILKLEKTTPLDSAISSCLAYFIAREIVVSTPKQGIVIAHNCDKVVAAALAAQAGQNDLQIFSTTSEMNARSSTCQYVHPRSTTRDLQALLPARACSFVDMSPLNMKDAVLAQRMRQCLPSTCVVEDAQSLLRQESFNRCAHDAACQAQALLAAAARFAEQTAPNEVRLSTPSQLSANLTSEPEVLVDWTTEQEVFVDVAPIDSEDLFSPDKSYLLIGLTGDLGRGLCEWMLQRGARHIAITSRKPNVDRRWLDEMSRYGAQIKICVCDVSDRAGVSQLYKDLQETMPRIAGVVNGAMVLRDKFLFDLEGEDFEAVFKPKVDGTTHLNEIFSANHPLDFFIIFSSGVSILGNSGQSAYAAANAFMTTLALNRKRSGLAASVLHLGAILGSGYATRELPLENLMALKRDFGTFLSDKDVYHSFAEAMVVGRPSSNASPEIGIGMTVDDPADMKKTMWHSNPRFSHVTYHPGATRESKSSATEDSLVQRVASTNDRTQAFEVIADAFLAKLASLLQLDVCNAKSLLESAADDLGVDSLIAVDIRTWVSVELSVDLPVLKILGGATIKELLDDVVSKLPEDAYGSQPAEASTATAGKAAPKPIAHEEQKSSSNTLEQVSEKLSQALESTEVVSTDSSASDGTRSLSQSRRTSISSNTSFGNSVSSPQSPSDEIGKDGAAKHISGSALERTEDISFAQGKYWGLPDSNMTNTTIMLKIIGKLRVEDFARAVEMVAQRHEILRTSFFEDSLGKRKQGIMGASQLRLEHRTISSYDEACDDFHALKAHRYNPEAGQTMRVQVLSQSLTTHFLLIGFHQMIMDGDSLQIFLSDMETAYSGFTLPSGVAHFSRHSARQRQQLADNQFQDDLSFWRSVFADIPKPLPLFSQKFPVPRSERKDFRETKVNLCLDGALGTRISELAKQSRVTPFHFYMTCLQALLGQCLKVNDVCIGFSDANRTEVDTIKTVGLFRDALPLRFQYDETTSFSDSLIKVKKTAQRALAHSKVPFDVMLADLGISSSVSHSSPFQVYLVYRGRSLKQTFSDCKLEYTPNYRTTTTGNDLLVDVLNVPGTDGEVHICFTLRGDLYCLEDGTAVAQAYEGLLRQFSTDPSLPLGHSL